MQNLHCNCASATMVLLQALTLIAVNVVLATLEDVPMLILTFLYVQSLLGEDQKPATMDLLSMMISSGMVGGRSASNQTKVWTFSLMHEAGIFEAWKAA